jgi:hypothetical protein
MGYHDAFRQGASQNLAYNAAAGASAASAAFGTQTYWIRVAAPGVVAAGSGVRIVVGDGTPTASATSVFLPLNWIEVIAVTPGQKIAALSNDTTGGNLSITELS